MQEIWRPVPIPEYSDYYQVSNKGRIKSLERVLTNCNGVRSRKREKILTQTKPYGPRKYIGVWLCNDTAKKQFYVHRLVADAFIPNPHSKPHIDHINTNPSDNRVENLRWVTSRENHNNPLTLEHAREAQRGEKSFYWGKKGKLHHSSKKLICLDTGIIYYGTSEASRLTGIYRAGISRCCLGQLNTCGGYRWKYID